MMTDWEILINQKMGSIILEASVEALILIKLVKMMKKELDHIQFLIERVK
jgi:hypothetical protein